MHFETFTSKVNKEYAPASILANFSGTGHTGKRSFVGLGFLPYFEGMFVRMYFSISQLRSLLIIILQKSKQSSLMCIGSNCVCVGVCCCRLTSIPFLK
jgi:hypothetical protein